jgi:quercetin dioxygenase-like cupin family protein
MPLRHVRYILPALALLVLIAAVLAQSRQSFTIHASKVEWKPAEIAGVAPGLMVRELQSNPANHTSSAVVRYPKGFFEPRHYHTKCSHIIYVLRGRLKSPEGEMTAGTLAYAAVTEPHGPFTAVEETEILFHVDGPFDYIVAEK